MLSTIIVMLDIVNLERGYSLSFVKIILIGGKCISVVWLQERKQTFPKDQESNQNSNHIDD